MLGGYLKNGLRVPLSGPGVTDCWVRRRERLGQQIEGGSNIQLIPHKARIFLNELEAGFGFLAHQAVDEV